MNLAEAMLYDKPFQRVSELVEPYRSSLDGQIHEKCFWKFWDRRPSLQQFMVNHDKALGLAVVTKYISFQFVPLPNVYNHKVKLLFFDQWSEFSTLQSSLHDQWARWRSGTLGSSTVNYSTSEALETFPMPVSTTSLSSKGQAYHEHRAAIMLARQEGLTATYNRFHDPGESAADIVRLRQLHVEMDVAVAAAYSWDDLVLGHDFHETQQGVRFTISEAARREVLYRLLALNHQRYAEEVEAGLHGKKAKEAHTKAQSRKGKDVSENQMSLL